MAIVQVKTAEPNSVAADSLNKQLHDLTCRLRHRAYHLFEARGGAEGSEVDDWLRAEKEMLVPIQSRIQTTDKGVVITLTVPEFSEEDLEVFTVGENLIVKGEKAFETCDTPSRAVEARSFFFQTSIPPDIAVAEMSAEVKGNVLTITAPKLLELRKVEPVSPLHARGVAA